MTTAHAATIQRAVLDIFRDIELLEANLGQCSRGTRRACALPLTQLKDDLAELHGRTTAITEAHPDATQALVKLIGHVGAEARRGCQFSETALEHIGQLIGQIRDIRNILMAAPNTFNVTPTT